MRAPNDLVLSFVLTAPQKLTSKINYFANFLLININLCIFLQNFNKNNRINKMFSNILLRSRMEK